MFTIYLLKDPRTGRIRYVGWCFSLRPKLYKLLAAKNKEVAEWVKELKDIGLKPELHTEKVDGVTEEVLREYLRRYADEPLLNKRRYKTTARSRLLGV